MGQQCIEICVDSSPPLQYVTLAKGLRPSLHYAQRSSSDYQSTMCRRKWSRPVRKRCLSCPKVSASHLSESPRWSHRGKPMGPPNLPTSSSGIPSCRAFVPRPGDVSATWKDVQRIGIRPPQYEFRMATEYFSDARQDGTVRNIECTHHTDMQNNPFEHCQRCKPPGLAGTTKRRLLSNSSACLIASAPGCRCFHSLSYSARCL